MSQARLRKLEKDVTELVREAEASKTEELPLSRIRLDGDTQPREAISQDLVTQYAEDLIAGIALPPIKAVFDGVDYWAWDGFHRHHAHREAGLETILVEVTTGTVDVARWLASSANKDHDTAGRRRTFGDKKNAVKMALATVAGRKKSDGAIAEHCGVTRQYVSRIRNETTSNSCESKERTGQDGRTINTANIGKPSVRGPQFPTIEGGPHNGRPYNNGQHLCDEKPKQPTLNLSGPISNVMMELSDNRIPIPVEDVKPKKTEYVTLEDWQGLSAKDRQTVIDEAGGETKFNDQKNDNIEWALWSWNPVSGCLHNCPYCYARDIAERFYAQKFVPSFYPSRLNAPRNTKVPSEAATWMGHKNVFTCSMADLFGRWVPAEWIEAVLEAVRGAPQWNFLFLTKFPQRLAEFEFPDNAWVGTTVDCQARVTNAEKAFKKVKAGVKWLSCEPLIEPLKFSDLSMFDWLVLGGASKSTQTPEWKPPRSWIYEIEMAAAKAKCRVYEKTNLLDRIRQYPGVAPEVPKQAPDQLRYLPTVEHS